MVLPDTKQLIIKPLNQQTPYPIHWIHWLFLCSNFREGTLIIVEACFFKLGCRDGFKGIVCLLKTATLTYQIQSGMLRFTGQQLSPQQLDVMYHSVHTLPKYF